MGKYPEIFVRGDVTGINHLGVCEVALSDASGRTRYIQIVPADLEDGNLFIPDNHEADLYMNTCFLKGCLSENGDNPKVIINTCIGGSGELTVPSANITANPWEVSERLFMNTVVDKASVIADIFAAELEEQLGSKPDRELVERAAAHFCGYLENGINEKIGNELSLACQNAIQDCELENSAMMQKG